MRRFVKWFLVVLVLLLVAGWFGIPALLQTSWAKEKVRTAIAEQTGRDVALGDISFSWTSGLVVDDVVVSQKPGPTAKEGPLFRLGSLGVRVGLGDLLKKELNVERLSITGPEIVVIRDQNGRFNFADILERGKAPSAASSGGEPGMKVKVDLDLSGGRILFIDQKLGTRIEASGIEADAGWAGGKLTVSLGCVLNGGEVKLKASADLSGTAKPFTVEIFSIAGAELSSELAQLAPFLPLMGEKPDQASGRLAFTLTDISAKDLGGDLFKQSLAGQGRISLSGGALGSGPVAQLYSILRGGKGGGNLVVDLLESGFRIAGGKILTDGLTVKGRELDLLLSGWTDLGGRIDYQVTASRLAEYLAKNQKLKKYIGSDAKLPLRMGGTLSSPQLTLDVAGALEGTIRSGIGGEIEKRLPIGR